MTNTTLPESVSKTIKLIVDGEEREIFMSYGLQNEVLKLIRDTNEIGNAYADTDTRNALIEQVLADRTKSGKITSKKSFDDYEIDIEEVEKLLAWVVDHATAFFIRAIKILDSKMLPVESNLTIPMASTRLSDGSEG